MKKTTSKSASEILRKKAEAIHKSKPFNDEAPLSEIECQKLIHEIRVNQINFDHLNKELDHVRKEAQLADEKYTDIYDFAPVGFITLSKPGKIIEINLFGSQLLGNERKHLINRQFGYFVSDETKQIYKRFLENVYKGSAKETCEVDLETNNGISTIVQLTGILKGNGEQCLITVIDLTKEKNALKENKKSEEKFRGLYDSMKDGVLQSDLNGKIVDCNTAFLDMLGYTIEEVKKLTSQQLTPGKWHKFEDDIIQKQIVFHGHSDEYEKEYIRKDGSVFPILIRVWLIKDNKGVSTGLWGIVRDITDRKRSEELLVENNSRLDRIMQMANMAWWGMDFTTGNVTFDKRKTEMIGYNAENFTHYKDFTDLVHPDDYQKAMDSMRGHLTGLVDKYEVEYRIKSKSGEYRYFYDYGTIVKNDPKGNPLYLSGYVTDITERKQVEGLLRNSEEKYRLITENSNDVIWKMNADTWQFTYISPSVKHMTGFAVEEAMQQSVFQSFSPKSANILISELPQSIANYYSGKVSDKSIIFELQQICKNGDYIWVEVSLTFLLDKAAKIVEIIGVSRNIEQRKQTEQIIIRKNEELNKVNAEKDKFFSIIAHDLRSPFNGFLGLFRLMEEQLPSMRLDEIQKITHSMGKSAKNLYSLIENLLDWSRMEGGFFEFNPTQIMLRSRVSDILITTIQSASIKEIEISYDIPADLKIIADENMFAGTIRNLTSNAVKFTPKGGKILIAAKTLPGNQVEISIKDSGIGISPEMKSNLFRLDGQTNRKGTAGEPSTGLGLIICKDFIEKHGGKIWLESEVGKGSVFSFTMPAKAQE